MTRLSPEGAFGAGDALPRLSSEELRELNRRADKVGPQMGTDAEARAIVDAYCRAHDYALITREEVARVERLSELLDHYKRDLDEVVRERDDLAALVARLEDGS